MLILKIIGGILGILMFIRLAVYIASKAWFQGYFEELTNIKDKEI